MTWRQLVREALKRHKKGEASLALLYESLESHSKAKSNVNWKAKVRQTVQLDPLVERVGQGVWRLKR